MSSVGSPKNLSNIVKGRDIPSRRMVVNSLNDLPHDYSSTPGGTLFSTTPGGTRIIYDRELLLHLRNSPMAKSPPNNLPIIPGVTSPLSGKENKPMANTVVNSTTATIANDEQKSVTTVTTAPVESTDEPQFSMDI